MHKRFVSLVGADKGVEAIVFENYSSQLIWNLVNQNDRIQRGLKRLGFKSVDGKK